MKSAKKSATGGELSHAKRTRRKSGSQTPKKNPAKPANKELNQASADKRTVAALGRSHLSRQDATTSSSAEIPLPPRKRARLATRRKLLAAARKLFAAHGYSATTPQDITREAGVAYGLFYKHFATKLDCYREFIKEIEYETAKIVAWFWPREKDTPHDFIPIMLRSIYEFSLIHPGTLQPMIRDNEILETNDGKKGVGGIEFLADRVDAWKKAGLSSANIDSTLFAYIVSGATRRGDDLVTRNPESLEEVVAAMTEFILHGLNVPDPKRKT